MMTRPFINAYIIIVVLGTFLIGSILLVKYCSLEKKESINISAHLKDIQTQLNRLQEESKKPNEKLDLRGINQDIHKLATLIEELNSKDNHEITQLVTENRKALSQKLDSLQEVLNSLDKKQHAVKYLPVTALPFKIISIDAIQQVSVVTVVYDYKTMPLEKTDKLANWTVLNIDFGQQRVEFENANKERVIVSMEGEHYA